jgi:hypothetical protein
MTTSPVAKAERMGRARVALFYLMAITFIVSTVMGMAGPDKADRFVIWLLLASLVAANLTPLGAWIQPNAVTRLLNDETTRVHRQASFVIGFWAAIASALALAVAVRSIAIASESVAKLIVTAALSAALIGFATLEWRANG